MLRQVEATIRGLSMEGKAIDYERMLAEIMIKGIARRTAKEYIDTLIRAGRVQLNKNKTLEVVEYEELLKDAQ